MARTELASAMAWIAAEVATTIATVMENAASVVAASVLEMSAMELVAVAVAEAGETEVQAVKPTAKVEARVEMAAATTTEMVTVKATPMPASIDVAALLHPILLNPPLHRHKHGACDTFRMNSFLPCNIFVLALYPGLAHSLESISIQMHLSLAVSIPPIIHSMDLRLLSKYPFPIRLGAV